MTADGKYFTTSEGGRVQIWNRSNRVVLYRDEQDDVFQLENLDEAANMVVAFSCTSDSAEMSQYK